MATELDRLLELKRRILVDETMLIETPIEIINEYESLKSEIEEIIRDNGNVGVMYGTIDKLEQEIKELRERLKKYEQ